MGVSRRTFLAGAGATVAAGIGFQFLKPREGITYPGIIKSAAKKIQFDDWSDVYREKWKWDRIVKGSHNRANCFSACSWNLFVKEGVVWREEQNANYDASRPDVPDFNPRGCQKGGCYSDLQTEPSRLLHPMKRTGERGEGKWKRITWDEAYDEIADAIIDAAVEAGIETVIHDNGTTNNDFGPDSMSEMRFTNALGCTVIDSWAGVGDMPNGLVQTWGMFNADGTTDDWFLSDYIVLWVANPNYTRIPDVHFVHEARYRGAKVVMVSPDFSASTVHADLWINPKHETDAAFGLAAANVIIEENLYDDEAVREQTDMPFLVREDDGRYLRESDLKKKGKDDLFYMWDEAKDAMVVAPGCAGEGGTHLKLDGIKPALDGRWEVDLADGSKVWVRPLFQVMRDHLNADYTPEKQEKTTGVKPSVVRYFARGLAGANAAMIYSSWGACKNYHSDLFQRAMALIMAITGNQGKKGGGYRVAAWWELKGADELGAAEFQPPMKDILKMIPKTMRGLAQGEFANPLKALTPREWEWIYTGYSNNFPVTPLMPFLWHHGGYDKVWGKPQHQDPTLPRTTQDYMNEAMEKEWMPIHPKPGTRPRVYIFTGSNPLRRWPSPQTAKEHLWPKFDLIVSTNFRMSTSTMFADIILPVGAYYEKFGVKYCVSSMPYIVACEQATPPLGESKLDYEVFGVLAQRISERAKARGVTEVEGPLGRPLDLTKVFETWSFNGELDPMNPRAVMDRIFSRSPTVGNISGDKAMEMGIVPVVEESTFSLVNQTCGDFKQGDTMTPFQWFSRDKMAWPTITGRQQFLIDHPWFMEGGESLPVHKDSPGMRSGYKLRLTSGHTRWSIHAIQRDQKMLLRLQRGEPACWMHPQDMAERGIKDHDKIRVFNDHGAFEARVKEAARMQPGMIQMYHAWEPYQFKDWKGQQEPVAAPWKPLHLAGGYGQLHYRMYYNSPGHNPRGIGIEVEKIS